MPDDLRPAPQPGFMLAEMPMQEPQAPTSPAASRARFFNSGNAFNLKLPPVPDHAFTDEPARALIFSSDLQAASRNVLPTLTLAMNSLPPGQFQRPHRHNSVAVSLVVQGQNCYSMIDGKRKDWAPWATTITPPVSSHSHHNDGDQRAYFLIVQDGGLYYHARTMGFSFT